MVYFTYYHTAVHHNMTLDVLFSAIQYTVQYSTVQYSTVQYSTVQYSTVSTAHCIVYCNTVLYGMVQYGTIRCITVRYSAVRLSDHPVLLLKTDYRLLKISYFFVNYHEISSTISGKK